MISAQTWDHGRGNSTTIKHRETCTNFQHISADHGQHASTLRHALVLPCLPLLSVLIANLRLKFTFNFIEVESEFKTNPQVVKIRSRRMNQSHYSLFMLKYWDNIAAGIYRVHWQYLQGSISHHWCIGSPLDFRLSDFCIQIISQVLDASAFCPRE